MARIRSLGYRTDIALREYAGSKVEDHGTHLVVRTPQNPTFWWGNFLLLPALADEAQAREWLEVFGQEFPQARHTAIGLDVTTGDVADLAGFVAAGMSADVSIVMTAEEVHPPPRPNAAAAYRPLRGDDDWQQQVDLSIAGEERGDGEFEARRAEADRELVRQGRGEWWGAFLDDRLVSSMGLFVASEGLARFQNVKTHPDARGLGLAGTLVHRVSRYGFDDLGAQTLVMVADPDYPAIRIYRAVGFDDSERELGCERAPG